MQKNKTVIILGSSGLLGRNFVRQYLEKKWRVIACYQAHEVIQPSPLFIPFKIDILDKYEIQAALNFYKPHLIIHCAGLTNVDRCEQEPDLAYKLNGESVREAASYSKTNDSQFVYISTDHLFSGNESFYTESNPISPLNVYAKSKLFGENIALEENEKSLIIRTNFFGRGLAWRQSLTDWLWFNLKQNKEIKAFEDSFFSPIAIPKLIQFTEDLISLQASGIFNVCGGERINKFNFAKKFANYFSLNENLIIPSLVSSADLQAPRPKDMSLATDKISNFLRTEMPNIEQNFEAIASEYINE